MDAVAYSEICTALIEAVHSVHPVHADVATDLQRTSAFASVFPTGVSLNYDLTLYWAMLLLNAAHGSWFKDAFHDGGKRIWNIYGDPMDRLQAQHWFSTLTAVLRLRVITLVMRQSSLLTREPQATC